jgi:hypothetical protein
MPDWKQLAAMTPEPSLLDAIAFSEREENMLSDEAIEAYITKMRALFRNRAFTQWMVDTATYIDTFGQGR